MKITLQAERRVRMEDARKTRDPGKFLVYLKMGLKCHIQLYIKCLLSSLRIYAASVYMCVCAYVCVLRFSPASLFQTESTLNIKALNVAAKYPRQ